MFRAPLRTRRRRLVPHQERNRKLFLESLETRQMLSTVGYIQMSPEQAAVEGVRPGILRFTKHLTDPQQDYSATVYFTVGFLQSPDGHGGGAETDDSSNYPWGNYSITLGVGESEKEIKIIAPLDDRTEVYEDLFF